MTLTQTFSVSNAAGFAHTPDEVRGQAPAAIANGSGTSTWMSIGEPGSQVQFDFKGIVPPDGYTFISWKVVVEADYIPFRDPRAASDPASIPDSPCVDTIMQIEYAQNSVTASDVASEEFSVRMTSNKWEGRVRAANYVSLPETFDGTFTMKLKIPFWGPCVYDEVKVYEVYMIAEFVEIAKAVNLQGSETALQFRTTMLTEDFYPTALTAPAGQTVGGIPYLLYDNSNATYAFIDVDAAEQISMNVAYTPVPDGRILYGWEMHARVAWVPNSGTAAEPFYIAINGPLLPQSLWSLTGTAGGTYTDFVSPMVGAEMDQWFCSDQDYTFPYSSFLFGSGTLHAGRLYISEFFVRCYFVTPTIAVPVEPSGKVFNPEPSALIATTQEQRLPIVESHTVYVSEATYSQPGFAFTPNQFAGILEDYKVGLNPQWNDVAYAQVGALGVIPSVPEANHWLPTEATSAFTVPWVRKRYNAKSSDAAFGATTWSGVYGPIGSLPPGKYRCYVATRVGTLGAITDFKIGPPLQFSQTYSEFEVAEPVLPSSDGTLGCGTHTVQIQTTGGDDATILPWSSLRYERVLDDTSGATIDIGTKDCSRSLRALLQGIKCWDHEIIILRDGEPVWSGPIVDRPSVNRNTDFVQLVCRDRSSWSSKRLSQYSRRYDQASSTSIFYSLLADGLNQQNPGLTPVSFGAGSTADLEVKTGEQRPLSDMLGELARSSVDYTCVHDTLWIGGGQLRFPELFAVVDEMNAELSVAVHGAERASRVTVIGAGGGPQSLPVLGRAELADSPVLLDVAVAETAVISGQIATQLAASRLAFVADDQREVSAILDRSYPVPMRALIPGSVAVVLSDNINAALHSHAVLSGVSVSAGADGSETVEVRLDL